MSNIIVKTILMDGPKKAVISLYLESDGVEGELTNYVVVDPVVDLIQATQNNTLTVNQVWYGFSWFNATLTFDDLVPYPSWQLPRDTGGYYDFRYFGGIKDRSGIDHTGKLYLTTDGFAPAGSRGTLVIEVKKD